MKRREFIRRVGAAVAVTTSAIRGSGASGQALLPEFDYIVVGAGSSGCVVANRLSADRKTRVLVLEAGGPSNNDPLLTTPGRWVSLIGSQYDWGYRTEPEPGLGGRPLTFPRGKVVGGSSVINAMTFIRGHRIDYDSWRRAGNDGWGYDDVLPSLKRIEDNSRGASEYRGAGGPLRVADCTDPHDGHYAFLEAARQLGYQANPTFDFHAPQFENGAGFYQKNIKNGRRHSAAEAFLAPVTGSRPNLQVVTGAQATKLLFEGTRATGIEYVRGTQRATARAAREIILCGGVIASPTLLMLSGIGPADHLKSMGVTPVVDLAGVGANLQDHLKLSIRWRGRTTLPPSTVTAGMFLRTHTKGDGLSSAPDLQFYVGRGVDQPDQFVTITVSLVRPRSRGTVRLRSADPLVPPVIRGNYLQEEADVAAFIEGVRLTRALGNTSAYEKLRGEEIEPGATVVSRSAVADFARRAVDTIYHPASTCRMGVDAAAVVDSRLRVRGIQGVRVADASIMPDVVSAPTNATCVMIGDRVASFILGA